MKKIIILLLAISMIFSFVACDNEQEVPKVSITATVFDKEPVKLLINADTSLASVLKNEQVKTLIGEETDYVILVNGKVEATSYVLKDGDKVAIIVNGEGTEESPRLISSAEELTAAVGENKHIKFLSDITVPANTWFGSVYTGTIDGDGHKLIIADPPMDVKYESESEFALFYGINGTIKNLKYETNGFKALVRFSVGNLVFDGVNAYGEMNGADTNVGPYLLFVNSNVTFKNCNNYVNIIDRMGGNHYGSAFVAGYVLKDASSTAQISFDHCNNYGKLFFGTHAGLFMGNPNNLKPENVTITESYNYGLIQAFGDVGCISWPNSVFNDTADVAKYNKEGGKIEKVENSITGFKVNADGSFEVTTKGITNAKILLQFNINYKFKSNGEDAGNRNMTLEYKIPADNKLPKAIMQADAEHKHESVKDGVLYIDPFAYEFKESECEVKNFDLCG